MAQPQARILLVLFFQTGMCVKRGLHSSPLPPADGKHAALEGTKGRMKMADYGLLSSLVNSLVPAPI